MTKKPICIDKDMLAAKALSIMNEKKITSLCVTNKIKKSLTGIAFYMYIVSIIINDKL